MFDDAVLIALGSSLAGRFGSRQALLEAALDNFPAAGLKLLKRSSWWRSASWPDPGMPDYLNGLALVETALSPQRTLAALRRLEAAFGRRREATNAPRTLDLDLIAHGRLVLDESDLTLPHPRAHERLFVMGPLVEIAPRWRHPVLGKTAAELVLSATVGADARPV
ncbi:MAG TPA: 2-amino-4-hydroxy-6-hydroxymethyldihydropteridine diphosphokinase [Caulobacteraceae bacterium]|nr:2-amino-4-hydroxy-6-hydroxymethyldihydropteridine diphosphokinase [Caulobacteraceae bacterium]